MTPSSRERLTQLVEDATAAHAGGHRTVPERLLQHRDLLIAVQELMDRDAKVEAAVGALFCALRRFPRYSSAPQGHGADAVEYRWGIKVGHTAQFHEAIKRLRQLCPEHATSQGDSHEQPPEP